MAKDNNNIRVSARYVRNVLNVVFYVEHWEKKMKDNTWQDSGWYVSIKHHNRDAPYHFDHCPNDAELKKLWRWH